MGGKGQAGDRKGRGDASNNPWRRAALAIEKERERAARHSKALGRGGAGEAANAIDLPPPVDTGSRSDGRFAIGRLGSPRGTEGDLHVHSYSGEISHFLDLDIVDLERASALHAATKLRLKISRVYEGPGGLSLAFEAYPTREAAEALVGMEIIVDRAKGARLARGEWYVSDLVGLELVSEKGLPRYGRIVALCEGGADPLLEVALAEGIGASEDQAATALIPFRKEFIGDIDLEKGTMILLAPWVLE